MYLREGIQTEGPVATKAWCQKTLLSEAGPGIPTLLQDRVQFVLLFCISFAIIKGYTSSKEM
jgi:hypothetical protein